MSGSIIISDLQIHVPNGLGPSAFGLTPPPPCLISLTLEMILEDGIISTDEDTMSGLGVNYSSVSKQIYANLSNPERTWKSPMEALSFAARLSLQNPAVKSTEVTLEISRALLHARSVTYSSSIAGEGVSSRRLKINGLQVSCVIGLHPHEQMERQRLEVDVFFPFSPDDLELKNIADNILSVSHVCIDESMIDLGLTLSSSKIAALELSNPLPKPYLPTYYQLQKILQSLKRYI